MLERLLPSETLKPFKERILTLALSVVRNDNEENAVLGAKVLTYPHPPHPPTHLPFYLFIY